MVQSLADRILDEIPRAARSYSRLILVVGPSGSGKTAALHEVSRQTGHPCINVNLEVSQRLLDLPERQRPLRMPALLGDMLLAAPECVLLDNTEMLFDPRLKQDPLRCLLGAGRSRTIVASWNGSVDAEHLVYAAPGHPEHRRYPLADFLVVRAALAAEG